MRVRYEYSNGDSGESDFDTEAQARKFAYDIPLEKAQGADGARLLVRIWLGPTLIHDYEGVSQAPNILLAASRK